MSTKTDTQPEVSKPSLRTVLLESRWLTTLSTPLLVILFLGIWKLYTVFSGISRFVLPPPEAVFAAFFQQLTDPYIWKQHVWTTFYEVSVGLMWAIIVGVSLGYLIGKSRLFEE